LGYIAKVLRENGHEVEVLDIDAFRYSKEDIINKIKEIEFDVVGIGGIVTTYKSSKWIINKIKQLKPDSKIIVGGHIGTTIPHLIAKYTKADYIVLWEGEETIIDLYDNFDDPSYVKGIWYKKDGRLIKNPPRGPAKNIDITPAYDLFPTEKYIKTMINTESKGIKKSINILTHRGCPYKCTFCIHSKEPEGMCRSRSIYSVIKEIKYLQRNYGIEFVHFFAETFVMNRQWVYDFCESLDKENIKIKWSCLSRVNLVDEELLNRMKSSGCTYVGYGIESASQKMLDKMNKGCTVEQQKKALKITKKLGLDTYPTFIIGTPGETKETVQESVNFCKELGLIPEFFFMTPFPMSSLYDYAMDNGLIQDENEYVENLGECRGLTMNMTDMSDEDLKNLKKKAEKEILIHYILRHPFKSIGKGLKLFKNYGISFLMSSIKRRT
jgi:radical SAM superfamily enzyme YgiQ (UPF0313 family)